MSIVTRSVLRSSMRMLLPVVGTSRLPRSAVSPHCSSVPFRGLSTGTLNLLSSTRNMKSGDSRSLMNASSLCWNSDSGITLRRKLPGSHCALSQPGSIKLTSATPRSICRYGSTSHRFLSRTNVVPGTFSSSHWALSQPGAIAPASAFRLRCGCTGRASSDCARAHRRFPPPFRRTTGR